MYFVITLKIKNINIIYHTTIVKNNFIKNLKNTLDGLNIKLNLHYGNNQDNDIYMDFNEELILLSEKQANTRYRNSLLSIEYNSAIFINRNTITCTVNPKYHINDYIIHKYNYLITIKNLFLFKKSHRIYADKLKELSDTLLLQYIKKQNAQYNIESTYNVIDDTRKIC
ncbi:MAG: hypothetical protein AAFO15_00955 [Pseudomonadota bacterium]